MEGLKFYGRYGDYLFCINIFLLLLWSTQSFSLSSHPSFKVTRLGYMLLITMNEKSLYYLLGELNNICQIISHLCEG